MKSEFLLDALFEGLALLQSQGVGLGDDGNHVDHVRQLLQHDNVDRLQRVTGGLDEEQAAMDAGVLDVFVAIGRELLAQVGGVLVLDVLDNRVPAAVVVDQVTVARGINNVEPKANAILFDDVGYRVDLGGRSDDFLGHKTTLGLDKVGGEDGIDESRLSEASLACGPKTHETRQLSNAVGISMRRIQARIQGHGASLRRGRQTYRRR